MHLECPHCSTENKIEYAEHIKCNQCGEAFSGYIYKKFKKTTITAGAALVLGVFGTYKVGQLIADERYPLEIEYEIVSACVNSSQNPMSRQRYVDKTAACICGLEETMKEISYRDYKKSGFDFTARFFHNTMSCY